LNLSDWPAQRAAAQISMRLRVETQRATFRRGRAALTENYGRGFLFRIIPTTGNSRSILTLQHGGTPVCSSHCLILEEVQGGMAKRIICKHGIRVATALSLLVAAFSSSHTASNAFCPARGDSARAIFGSPVSHPARLSAGAVSPRLDRMKAVSTERQQGPGRPMCPACGESILPAAFHGQPERNPPYSGPFCPHKPLRC
jgi:hypothetical protein